MGKHGSLVKTIGIILAFLAAMMIPAMFTPASDDVEEDWIIGASPKLVQKTEDLSDYTLIYTYEDMEQIRKDPSGAYKLMNDIDFAGKTWKPLDFSGTFEGSGFAVLNCTVGSVTDDSRLTYDGNMIDYDTVFAGFFGITENAVIRDFSLYGLNVDVHVKGECFAGGMAGYTDETVIENCTIEGKVSLYVDGKQIGTGGAVGFGNGEIINCTIDTTQICVDENADEKDEQFMGGVNANGYMSITQCDITIRGYDSDHGYVHDGGLSGMFIVYPEDNYHYGYITDNRVNGFITFFEDNEDRRAYCERGIGEDMSETYDAWGNEYDFEADERFEYDQVLLPHTCENPTYTKSGASGICPDYGHTVYTCDQCGYSYKADYTSSIHTPIGTETLIQAVEEAEGLEVSKCALCGIDIYEKTSAEPESVTQAAPQETTAEQAAETSVQESTPGETTAARPVVNYTGTNVVARIIVIALIVLVLALIAIIIILAVRRKKEKERLRRIKAERRRARKQQNGR